MWYFLINNKPILIRFMLAAGIVQDRFAGDILSQLGVDPCCPPELVQIFLLLAGRHKDPVSIPLIP